MARVFSDLRNGSGQRYFYSLATAPGGTNAGAGTLTISGLAPTVFQQVEVFRNPGVATLTINGRSLISDVIIAPTTAVLSLVGQIPGEYRSLVVTNDMPLDYTDLPSIPPTVLFIDSKTPAPALLTLESRAVNVTQGGDIAFISPGVGSLAIQGQAPVVIFLEAGVGLLSIQGLIPTIYSELTVEIEVGSLAINGQLVTKEQPFQWIDVDPPPTVSWTTTTGVAA